MTASTIITLFGIPNCDTVKKARTWLEQHAVPFTFHNFKKDGLTSEQVDTWLQKIDFATLINRKGTSWRALSEEQKSNADQLDVAKTLILSNPSLIKRPVLQIQNEQLHHVGVGFNEQLYLTIFKEFKSS